MRSLKFRVWDKEEKEYYYNAEHTYDFFCSGRGCYAESFGEVLDHPDRFIVEQYTGLQDKTGKEVYDGDIVSEYNGDIIGQIVQDASGQWRIEWIGIYGGSNPLYEEQSACKVIGNIHENPGLLVEYKND